MYEQLIYHFKKINWSAITALFLCITTVLCGTIFFQEFRFLFETAEFNKCYWFFDKILDIIGGISLYALGCYVCVLIDENLKKKYDMLENVHISSFFLCYFTAFFCSNLYVVLYTATKLYNWWWFTPYLFCIIWVLLIMITISKFFYLIHEVRIAIENKQILVETKTCLDSKDLYRASAFFIFFLTPFFVYLWSWVLQDIYMKTLINLNKFIEVETLKYDNLLKAAEGFTRKKRLLENFFQEEKARWFKPWWEYGDFAYIKKAIAYCETKYAETQVQIETFNTGAFKEAQLKKEALTKLSSFIEMNDYWILIFIVILAFLTFFLVICSLAVDQNFRKILQQKNWVYTVASIFQLIFNLLPAFIFLWIYLLDILLLHDDSRREYVWSIYQMLWDSYFWQISIFLTFFVFLGGIYISYLNCEIEEPITFEELLLFKRKLYIESILVKTTGKKRPVSLLKIKFHAWFFLYVWNILWPMLAIVFANIYFIYIIASIIFLLLIIKNVNYLVDGKFKKF